MCKKRNLRLLLLAPITLGLVLASNNFESNVKVTKAETNLIELNGIIWDNVDYSYNFGPSFSPNTTSNGIPLSGYCFLADYKSNIANATYTGTNILDMGLTGCNAGDHILVNGVALKNVDDAILYCYPQTGLFLYIPQLSITQSADYDYLTVDILDGMSLDGTYQVKGNSLEFRNALGADKGWLVDPEPAVFTYATFERIDWNNMDYSPLSGNEWAGELNGSGAPINGYSLLVFFVEEGKDRETTSIGSMNTTGRGVIGNGHAADTLIKVNGIGISQVDDAKCYIYPEYGLFFYLPEDSLTFNETYTRPTIEITAGLHFNSVKLPYCRFEFEADLGEVKGWRNKLDAAEVNHFPFGEIMSEWNNVNADSTHTQTVLRFGEYGTDNLKNDGVKDENNQVKKYSDCGNKITVNGLPLNQIPDAIVNYAHQNCYFYFYLPTSVLTPSNGYKVVTFHIQEGTEFWDTALPEVSLYLYNGKWTTTKPETPLDEDYDDAKLVSDVFSSSQITLTEENPYISGETQSTLNSFSLFFDYKLESSTSAFNLVLMSKDGYKGYRISVSGGEINLYDETSGSSLLGTAKHELFAIDEWFSILFYTRVINGVLNSYVAIDDIVYIHSKASLSMIENLGNSFNITLLNGQATFRDATFGADIKKPVLTFTGKSVYGVLEGSDILDFTNKCSAVDVVDGNVSSLIEYIWPEGSITAGKLNKGTWEVKIVAKDTSNNVSSLSVIVVVSNKLDVTVTFDGENATTYTIGDKIACIADPIKDGNGVNEYKFIGWYYNGKLWDFENDYITCDMNLESRFQEVVQEFCVSFNVEGLDNVKSYVLYFANGTNVNISTFEKEGYSLKAYIAGEEVTSFVVTSNMNVKLVYAKDGQSEKKGCSGNIQTSAILLSMLSGAALILLVFLKKKGGIAHE